MGEPRRALPGPRLCVDCQHVHGGRGYGLCYETIGGDPCPCIVPHTQYVARDVSARTLVRRAAKVFAALTPGQRAWWAKWVERWRQTDMTLHEFAVESGLDERLLYRTWRSLPAGATGGGGSGMSGNAMPVAGDRELDRAPEPGTVVPCPLKAGAQIGVGRCVEWQRDNGCHCEHALVALNATKDHLEQPHQRTEAEDVVADRHEQLDAVRELIRRAEQIERARPEPPAARVDSRGLPEGGLRRQVTPQQQQPAMPAKEKQMADEKQMCAGGCGRKLRINSRGDRCKFCRVAGSPEPVKPRAAKPKAAAPPDDVVALLQTQLDGCDRCARLRRAIEALNG